MSNRRNIIKASVAAAAATLLLASAVQAQSKPDKFKIGGVVSLSDPYGLLGEDMRRGVQIAIEERQGKVLGVPIEVTWEDDETKPQPAVQKATKLVSEGAHMIFGALSSASTLAIMNITKQRKIPHLVTISADDKITLPGGSRYTFRTSNTLDIYRLRRVGAGLGQRKGDGGPVCARRGTGLWLRHPSRIGPRNSGDRAQRRWRNGGVGLQCDRSLGGGATGGRLHRHTGRDRHPGE